MPLKYVLEYNLHPIPVLVFPFLSNKSKSLHPLLIEKRRKSGHQLSILRIIGYPDYIQGGSERFHA
jgi:hypothetical protein